MSSYVSNLDCDLLWRIKCLMKHHCKLSESMFKCCDYSGCSGTEITWFKFFAGKFIVQIKNTVFKMWHEMFKPVIYLPVVGIFIVGFQYAKKKKKATSSKMVIDTNYRMFQFTQ
jgi:hypothetical protein